MIPYSSEFCLCFRVILGNTTVLSTLSKNVKQKGFLGASLITYYKHQWGCILNKQRGKHRTALLQAPGH